MENLEQNDLQVRTVDVTYRVKYIPREGMILPDIVLVKPDWLPIRHGVLLNEYMKWCRDHRGSKQEFAKRFASDIIAGKYPLLEKTVLDAKQEPFTYQSIMSQIDWLAQRENQVIVMEDNSTEKSFYQNNLMLLTSKQKSEEAKRAREKELIQKESAYAGEQERVNAFANFTSSLVATAMHNILSMSKEEQQRFIDEFGPKSDEEFMENEQ